MASVVVLSASDRDRLLSKIEQAHKLLASVTETLSAPVIVQTSEEPTVADYNTMAGTMPSEKANPYR